MTLERLNHSCPHFWASLLKTEQISACASEVSVRESRMCVRVQPSAGASYIYFSPNITLFHCKPLPVQVTAKKSPTMLWIRNRSIRHMITWCGISGLESSKLLLQLLRCDTGSPTALCRGVWLFLRELPDTVVSALWETSAVARSGTANISRKCSLHAALSQQTLHLIPCVSSHDGYMSWHQRKGVRALRLEWWAIKWIIDGEMPSRLNSKSDSRCE